MVTIQAYKIEHYVCYKCKNTLLHMNVNISKLRETDKILVCTNKDCQNFEIQMMYPTVDLYII